jgi:hypothetical protein
MGRGNRCSTGSPGNSAVPPREAPRGSILIVAEVEVGRRRVRMDAAGHLDCREDRTKSHSRMVYTLSQPTRQTT